MRIFMLGAKGIPAHAAPGGGGVERHVEEVSARLAERGHDVFVYVRSYATPKRFRTYRGAHLIRLPSIRTKNLDTITHTFLATIHVLFQDHVDVIHYHGIGPSTLAWIPRLFKPSAQVIATFHSRDRFDPKWSIFGRAYLAFGEWACVTFPHATVVVSHVLQVFCRKLYGKETIYIPNGADVPPSSGTAALTKFGLKPGKYFLGVGRLVPNKAYDILINAYHDVEGDLPLVIAGDAEYASDYVEQLKKLAKQDKRVKLVGFQSGETLNELYAHCYAFVHPSRSEGLSTAVLEAMAHGKLVLMSDIKENLELVDHSGISFEVDNVSDLRQHMRELLQEPQMVKERGERAERLVASHYSWDSVTDRLERCYETLHASAFSPSARRKAVAPSAK